MNCIICNKPYYPIPRHKKTCSKKCQWEHKLNLEHMEKYGTPRTLHQKSCVICDADFETTYSNKLTCSKECSDKHQRIIQKQWWVGKKKCIQCKKGFKPNHGLQRLCSEQCKQDRIREKELERLPERRKYAKSYRKENRIKVNEYQRQYRIDNNLNRPLETRTCVICEIPFDTYHPNKITCSDKCSKINKAKTTIIWTNKYPDKRNQTQNEWRKKNPQTKIWNLWRKQNRQSGLMEEIWIQQNQLCKLCNQKLEYHQVTHDHIIPLSKGGSNDPSNIQVTCQSCNSKKGAKIEV